MVKLFFTLILFSSILSAFAQEEFKKENLIKFSTTIAPSTKDNIYLHGYTEYYTSEKISLRGDVYVNVIGQRKSQAVFTGFNYHFKEKGNFDPFLGVQPGICKYNYVAISGSNVNNFIFEEKIGLAPLINLSIGANYFVGKYFNFFASTAYLLGSSINQYLSTIIRNELVISAGLGFNFRTKKKN